MSSSSTARRLRSSAGLLVAVATMVAVACTLVALVPIYSAAIVEAGVRGTIADADATDSAIDVTTRVPAAQTGDVVAALGDGVLAPNADAFRTAAFAESRSFRIVEPPIDVDPDTGTTIITSLATFVGDDLVRATSGDLTAIEDDGEPDGAGAWPAALHVDAADVLGVEVGDVIRLESPGDVVDVELVALFEPVDPDDARWFGDPLGRLGTTTSGSFTEVGPFFVPLTDFVTLDSAAAVTGRFALDEQAIDSDDIDSLIATIGQREERFDAALAPNQVRVATGLDDLLADTDTSLRSTSAVVAAILLQLAAVALYGLGVASSVLVASRASERILLHSRGIGTAQVGRDAALEAVIIAVPAAVIGPMLATVAVRVVGQWGPLAATGLELRGTVSPQSFVLSALAAAVAVAIITWPAISAARAPTSARHGEQREPFLRRTGLDVVLFVAAALGLWQLRRTGSVATSSSPDSRSSVDPVLVLAPTLGVAAASLLAVRLLGLCAVGLERVGTRSRRLAPALAGWEAARQGARRNRSSVLIVVAVAVASFALVHAVSWERSQQDQADAEVGADIVATPDQRADAGVDDDALAASYRSVDGVVDVAPIDDRSVALTSEFGAVPLVAVDAPRFAEYSRTRSDIVATPDAVADLANVPDLDGITLPATGGEVTATVDVTTSAPSSLDLALVVVDEFGVFRRLEAAAPLDATVGSTGPSSVSFGHLQPSAAGRPSTQLVEIEVIVPVPFVDLTVFVDQDGEGDGDGENDVDPFEIPGVDLVLTMSELAVGGTAVDVAPPPTTAIAPPPGRFTLTPGSAAVSTVDRAGITAVEMAIATGTTGQRQVSNRFRFLTSTVPGADEEPTIDVLATPALIEALGVGPGDSVSARIGSLRTQLRIAGDTDVVPFAADETFALLADQATLAAFDYLATGTVSEPLRWALVVDERDHEAVTATLRAQPFTSVAVEDRWARAEQRTRDPVLIGLTGSLLLAIVAVGIVALVGLVMSAVTGARDRRSAHAVLRALGASRSELRRWLVRETIPLGIVATLVGVLTGVLISSLVLSALAGDRDGTPAIPSPQLVVPWAALAVLVGGAIVAVAMLPLVMSRLLRGVRPADELRIGDQR